MTSLGLAVVPVPVLIDEYGVVQNTRPKVSQLAEFVNTTFSKPEKMADVVAASQTNISSLRDVAKSQNSPADFCRYGDACLQWGGTTQLDEAIAAYQSVLDLLETTPDANGPSQGALYFRLGVAHRGEV